jgi:mutual gliding-motility protein MglA
MASINHEKKELLFKLVYYGCGCGGKTTNVEYIHRTSRPEMRGKLLSLSSETERTLFFDLLPIDLGKYYGYSTRLHLCTVPGQAAFDKTRRLILKGADGIIFVVNSDRSAIANNLASAQNLEENLILQNIEPRSLPLVVQLNKRDLPSATPKDELCRALGLPPEAAIFEAVATKGTGVYDTLKEMVRQCLRRVGDPRRRSSGRLGLPVAAPATPQPSAVAPWRIASGMAMPAQAPAPVVVKEMRTRVLP